MQQPQEAPEGPLPGALSFDDLLAQLQQTHQLELQELRRQRDALSAALGRLRREAAADPRELDPGGSGGVEAAKPHPFLGTQALQQPCSEPSPPALGEAGHSGSGAAATASPEASMQEPDPQGVWDAQAAVEGRPFLGARPPKLPSEVPACPEHPPADLEVPDLGSVQTKPAGDENSIVVAKLTSTKSVGKRRSPLAHIEPKPINFHELCMKAHPNRTWEALSTAERAQLIRAALQPTGYLLNPRSFGMMHWDVLVACALVFVGTVTPYEVVFLNDIHIALFVVNRTVDCIFIVDIALQFFRKVEISRPHHGGSMMLSDPKEIRVRYLKSWFLLDVVSIFPFETLGLLLSSASSSVLQRAKILRCLKLMRLAKLLRMLRTSRILQRWQATVGLQFATQKIVKFCVVLVMFSHWMACIWGLSGLNLVPELCDDQGTLRFDEADLRLHQVSWVTALYMGGKTSPDSPCDHFDIYAASLHWSVMTITSIGYGDIVPVRVEEYIVGIICMLGGGVLWAYIIGSLCSIISNASEDQKTFEANTDVLNRVMEEARVPNSERPRYREYLREAKAFDRRISFSQVAERFSPMLRKNLMFHVSRELLGAVSYFNDPETPPGFALEVASRLIPKFFSRGEPLDDLRQYLCIMDRGTVLHAGRVLVRPAVFHEDFIITERKYRRAAKTVSLSYTQILVLSKEDMEAVLEPYPLFERKIRRCALSHRRRMLEEGEARVTLSQAFNRVMDERGFDL